MNENKQYIYVMSCPSLPHLVKIGFSSDLKQREEDLSRGIPTFFKIEKSWESNQARKLETTIHKCLSFCRISSNREFFGLSVKKAIEAIDNIIESGIYENKEFNKNEARNINNMISIGKLIKYERKKQKISQKELALVCGTGLRLIGDIERGKPTAHVGNIFKILDMLKIETFCVTKTIQNL